MAGKVQLDIYSSAHLEGLTKAQAGLEAFGLAGMSANKIFKSTGSIDAYKAALERVYHSAGYTKGQISASSTAIGAFGKAFEAAQQKIGKGGFVGMLNADGLSTTITKDINEVAKYLTGFLDDVMKDTENFSKAVTKDMDVFSPEKFSKDIDKDAKAIGMFGTNLEALEYRMGRVREQGIRMATSGGDPEQVKALSEEYAKLSKEHDVLSKSINGTGNRIKNLLKNFVSAQLIVWALRTALSGIVNMLKESSKAAAEAEQVFGRFDAVFDQLERANKAVSNLVDNFGVAKSSAADIVSSIGNTAFGFGASSMEAAQFSEKVSAALSDIMAFRDVSGTISDFSQRFMSGASGNVENYRAIGSIVREGMVDLELQKQGWAGLTGQSLEWAKVQARVNIVLEQQSKAMGATEREWESMLSIQRRNKEQTKELNENIGESVNKFFKPMSQWILTLKENWNAAFQAKEDYNNGKYDPIPEADYKDTPAARVLRGELIAARNVEANAMATGAGGSFNITELDQVRDFAERFGATLRYTAEEATNVGLKIDQSIWSQIDAYDAYIKKINDYRKAESDRIATSQASADAIRDFSADIGSKMGIGRSAGIPDVAQWASKDANSFVSPLDSLLGLDGDAEKNLETKVKALTDMFEQLFNTSISGSTDFIKSQASQMMAVVGKALTQAKNAQASIKSKATYDENVGGIEKDIASMEQRNRLTAKYGEENEDIITLAIQRESSEATALKLLGERLETTDDEQLAMKEYNRLMLLISKQYNLQLDSVNDRIQAERDAMVVQASTSAGSFLGKLQGETGGDTLTEAEKEKNSLYLEMFNVQLQMSKENMSTTQFTLDAEKLINELYGKRVKDAEAIAIANQVQSSTSAGSFLGQVLDSSTGDSLTDAEKERNDLYRQMFAIQLSMSESGISSADFMKKAQEYINSLYGKRLKDAETIAQKEKDAVVQQYTDRNNDLATELSMMDYRATLMGQYADDESGIVDLLVNKKETEAEALAFMNQQVKAGMDAKEAEDEYQRNLTIITAMHGKNLQSLIYQIEATRQLNKEQSQDSADSMLKTATREMSYFGGNGAALKEQDSINDKVEQYIDYLSKTDQSITEVITKAKTYRTMLEDIALLGKEDPFKSQSDTLEQSIATLELRASIEGKYSDSMEDIELKRIQAEQEAWKAMQEEVDSGSMTVTEADAERLEVVAMITKEYNLQASALERQEKIARQLSIEQFKGETASMASQNATSRRNLSQPQNAKTTYDNAIADIGPKLQAEAETLFKAIGTDLSGDELQGVISAFDERRTQMELEAETEYLSSLKAARDASLESIASMWEGLGDVGMVKGWADTFKNVKAFELSEGATEEEAGKAAWGNVGMQILMEFLGRLETVNEMLSMVSSFMDMMAPIVDQFLAPLMVIIEPILEMLGNMLIPILVDLFPVIQALATGLIWVVTVVSWVTAAVRYAIGVLTFWTSEDNTSWSDVQAIWDEGVQTTKEIWELEIDARAEYVSALTDAQKGELDAYNEMFKSGLLTLSQYQAMVGKNIYGKNYDNVDIESFASGADFITNGEKLMRVGEAGQEHVTVTPLNSTKYATAGATTNVSSSYSVAVSGANASPQEIALAVRSEFKRMERRGVAYA